MYSFTDIMEQEIILLSRENNLHIAFAKKKKTITEDEEWVGSKDWKNDDGEFDYLDERRNKGGKKKGNEDENETSENDNFNLNDDQFNFDDDEFRNENFDDDKYDDY